MRQRERDEGSRTLYLICALGRRLPISYLLILVRVIGEMRESRARLLILKSNTFPARLFRRTPLE